MNNLVCINYPNSIFNDPGILNEDYFPIFP
jgi:hypothetical protein